ncbi:patatin-like phospholipase family protein [Pedobacter gandavensis]|uniref:BamA/TamA family outer membrane protein n=1 Tax=Pedobacter gandavensis TaxID=2679963 RepID=A0ABR6EXW6_9SPHI|nr:patatin-like phospholipase family protein [Pedobacter gandavensis]MBB2149877.1 BamA/TamA family outer membrane protein [Pedobacter gandavensis]
MFKRVVCCLSLMFYLCFANRNQIFAQTKGKDGGRPKIGLALSGGGAKGMAHIGLLRLIDSLGIKVDYISGTSAGGIFGGLYAIGYHPDTLKKIALGINWRRVLSNKVPLRQINIEEKDEYDNYMIEFPVLGGRPRLPSAMIEGQYMSEVLNTLTYSAKHINDFNKLPIPITITSSDIVNGGLVLQHKGSLPLAIRATLAIPAAFAPVWIDGHLLVDGGLDRNFPVQEVKDMGADIVIGGYTGFRLFTEKEIENPMKLIYQTHAFRSVEDAKKQEALADVVVDFTQALSDFSAADFYRNKRIIEIGEQEARKYLPQLIKIAEDQKKYKLDSFSREVKDPNLPVTEIVYQNDKGQPLDLPVMEQFANSRLGLKTGRPIGLKKLNEGVEDLFGTQFFDKVYYTFENNADTGLTLNMRLKQGKPGVFKAAVHYDTEQSAGLIINYTYRNIFLRKSRLLATVDLSERFKGRFDYYKFINSGNRLWFKASFNYQALQNNSILYRLISDENYFNNTLTSEVALGYSLGRSTAVALSLSNENEAIKRGPNLFKRFFGEGNDIRTLYRHSNEALALLFKQNTLDNLYFPKKGNTLVVQAKYLVNNRISTKMPDSTDTRGLLIYDFLNPPPGGLPGNIFRFFLSEHYVERLSRRISLSASATWGFNYSDKYGFDAAYMYENAKFSMGGIDPRQDIGQSNFIGLKRGEFGVANVTSFGLALQYNLRGNLYLTPQVNLAWENGGLNPFKVAVNNDYLFGYGAKLGYMSFIGPINFSIAKTNGFDRNPWRMYLSIGFKF